MGINARCSDVKTELIERVTHSREGLERELRNQVRQGRLSVMDYLTKHKGYKPEPAHFDRTYRRVRDTRRLSGLDIEVEDLERINLSRRYVSPFVPWNWKSIDENQEKSMNIKKLDLSIEWDAD